MTTERKCLTCHRVFTVEKVPVGERYQNRGRYCSRKCQQNRSRTVNFDTVLALQLWEGGLSCHAIAPKVGSTEVTIKKWLVSLGKFEKRYEKGKNRYNWKESPKQRRTQRIRKDFLELCGARCSKCGYCKHAEVLEIHHKDENRLNDDFGNLELLCPTCHTEHHFETKTGKWATQVELPQFPNAS